MPSNSHLRPPTEINLAANIRDLRDMPAAGSLTDHLGAPPLPLHGVCRHPELVLRPRPQLRHPVAGGAPRHLVTCVTLLSSVLDLSVIF